MKRFVKIHFFENLRVALRTGCATSRWLGNTYKDMIMNKNIYVYFYSNGVYAVRNNTKRQFCANEMNLSIYIYLFIS